jgi:hypothetical protein
MLEQLTADGTQGSTPQVAGDSEKHILNGDDKLEVTGSGSEVDKIHFSQRMEQTPQESEGINTNQAMPLPFRVHIDFFTGFLLFTALFPLSFIVVVGVRGSNGDFCNGYWQNTKNSRPDHLDEQARCEGRNVCTITDIPVFSPFSKFGVL